VVEVSQRAEASSLSDRSTVVALTVGKSKRAVLRFEDGRIVGSADDDDVEVTIPFTAQQLEAMMAGRESMAQAYIRGDLKPEGSTGAFLAAVELFESGLLADSAAGAGGAAP
jgi:hypothetical protein